MSLPILFPQVAGKRLQKIEGDIKSGVMVIHTKEYVIRALVTYAEIESRSPAPEPLVVK